LERQLTVSANRMALSAPLLLNIQTSGLTRYANIMIQMQKIALELLAAATSQSLANIPKEHCFAKRTLLKSKMEK